MKRYIAIVVIKPDIKEKRINKVQTNIVNLFEQNANVTEINFEGKNTINYSKYKEGIFIKFEFVGKTKKVEHIKTELSKNQDVVFSTVLFNNSADISTKLPSINLKNIPFIRKKTAINNLTEKDQIKKVYMLVSKHIKEPFVDSDIIAVSESKDKIFDKAKNKIYEYIIMKGYHTVNPFKNIKDVEKEFRSIGKVKFRLENNMNFGKELVIQEKYLI